MGIVMSAHEAASSASLRRRKSGTVLECSVTAQVGPVSLGNYGAFRLRLSPLSKLEMNVINATLKNSKNFNQLFTYDATLGKYIYTQEGLQEALNI